MSDRIERFKIYFTRPKSGIVQFPLSCLKDVTEDSVTYNGPSWKVVCNGFSFGVMLEPGTKLQVCKTTKPLEEGLVPCHICVGKNDKNVSVVVPMSQCDC
jgi:hypothetical protein